MLPARDPLRELQIAAARAAEHLSPGERAIRIIVLGIGDSKLFEVPVPQCCCDSKKTENASEGVPETPTPRGWVVTDRGASFEGQPVNLRGRNLDLLRVFVSGDVVNVDELREAWEGYKAEESTIRWQVGELRKALKKLFGDFPGEPIESTGSGYRLLLR